MTSSRPAARRHVLQVCLTAEEHRDVHALAYADGSSASTYVRRLVLAELRAAAKRADVDAGLAAWRGSRPDDQ